MNNIAKPDRMPWVSPYLTVRDVSESIAFYEKAFNFLVEDISKNEANVPVHAELRYKDMLIMVGKEGAFGGKTLSPKSNNTLSPISLYIYVENVDEFFKNAISNSAEVEKETEDTFWGDRMCSLKDPDGYSWCFATTVSGK